MCVLYRISEDGKYCEGEKEARMGFPHVRMCGNMHVNTWGKSVCSRGTSKCHEGEVDLACPTEARVATAEGVKRAKANR